MIGNHINFYKLLPIGFFMDILPRLKEFLYDEQNCIHNYPKKFTLVDLMDRKGNLVRAYFCKECQEYRWRQIKDEPWTSEAFLKIKENQYQVYSSREGLSLSKKVSQK